MRGKRTRGFGPVAATVTAASWAVVVALGFGAIEAYERRPGAAGSVPAAWPPASALGFAWGRPHVVMAVHPRCPCSRASLEVLAEMTGRLRGPSTVRLLVFRPEGSAPGWAGESFAKAAGQVLGAELADDPGGREAARFGLATSGAVAAFDASGVLKFSGGLTATRGRAGDSEGAEAVSAVLRGDEPARRAAVVFGCGLRDATRAVSATAGGREDRP